MGHSSSPPPAPDPTLTAAAQTGTNIQTAIANANLSHVNQTDAYGDKSTYTQTGTTPFTDPTTGTVYQIPQYSQATTLSPGQQSIYNTTQGAEQNLANAAQTASGNAASALGNPVNLQSLNLSTLGALPNADLSANNINKYISTSWEEPFNRLAGQEMEHWNQNLADQGINVNDPAYNNAQYNLGQTLQGQQDTYANAMYGTAASNILAQNAQTDQNLVNQNQINNQSAATQAGFNNQVALQEQNQPINEISALLSGSQISTPSFATTPQTTIPTTDYAGITNQGYQNQLAAYNASQANSNATMGGLFGLGGSVITGAATIF